MAAGIIAETSKAAPFVFFAAMMGLQFVVVAALYPETKGVSLEEMQNKLALRRARSAVPGS